MLSFPPSDHSLVHGVCEAHADRVLGGAGGCIRAEGRSHRAHHCTGTYALVSRSSLLWCVCACVVLIIALVRMCMCMHAQAVKALHAARFYCVDVCLTNVCMSAGCVGPVSYDTH